MPSYPSYQPTESSYEEYDLNVAGRQYEAGPSSPMPRPLSAYSSPPPPTRYSGARHRQSLDAYAHGYGRPPAPTSAPGRYTNIGYREPAYNPHEHMPGQFSGAYDTPADYWYAGPPPSDGHSSYGGWQTREYAGPPSAYGSEPPLDVFDVNAPHHMPGHRGRDPRHNTPLPNHPNWSRTWYDGHMSANGHAYTMVRPPSGNDGWEIDTFTRSGRSGYHAPSSADQTKAERMRMLEKEFGKPKISHRGDGDEDDGEEYEKDMQDYLDPDAEVPIGGVTSRGKLVTERPRTDIALRCLIGLTALAVVGCGIGGDLLIKAGDKPPPAKGSMPSYVLYIVSILAFLIIAYTYFLRVVCCNPMRKELKTGGMAGGNPMAGMVIPVIANQQQGKQKGFKFGKGKKSRMGMMQQPPPTVNLIVNPDMFGERRKRKKKGADSDDSDDDSESERLGGGRRKHLSPGEVMQMQRRWQVARKSVKIRTGLDALLFVAYVACSVVTIGLGKSKPCPANAGNGWCTYYHAAIACGVIQAFWLIGALFLDYRDLSVSRQPPRASL